MCVYICTHVHMYGMFISVLCTYMCVHVYVVYKLACVHMCDYEYICVCLCMHMFACVCVCLIYIDTCVWYLSVSVHIAMYVCKMCKCASVL